MKILVSLILLFSLQALAEEDVCGKRDVHVTQGLAEIGLDHEIVPGFIEGQLRVSSGIKGTMDKNTRLIEAEKDILKPYGWGRFMISPEDPENLRGKRFAGVHIEAEIYKDNHHDLEVSALRLHEILRKPRVQNGPVTSVLGPSHANFLDVDSLNGFFQNFRPAPIALDHRGSEPGRLFFPRDHQGPRWKSLTMLLGESVSFESNYILYAFLTTVYRDEVGFGSVVAGGRRVDTCFYFLFE